MIYLYFIALVGFAVSLSAAASGLQTPVPASAVAHPSNFAQSLVDKSLKAHPDLLVIAFHVVPPGDTLNRVVAIDRVQIPKFLWRPSDEIDTDTAKTSRTVVQVIPATHRMEVHMPMHNKFGATVGTLVTVYNFKDEEEAPEFMRRSQAIRDELAPEIIDVPQLLTPQ